MRVWLAAFVLLFAIIELFEWFVQLGSWQPTGMWLILGGMGLAALSNIGSNAGHLSKSVAQAETITQSEIQPSNVQQPGTQPSKTQQIDAQQKATPYQQGVAQLAETKTLKVTSSLSNESDQDSISFKVRPLKR